jgi:FixJ family two-component response regulator
MIEGVGDMSGGSALSSIVDDDPSIRKAPESLLSSAAVAFNYLISTGFSCAQARRYAELLGARRFV